MAKLNISIDIEGRTVTMDLDDFYDMLDCMRAKEEVLRESSSEDPATKAKKSDTRQQFYKLGEYVRTRDDDEVKKQRFYIESAGLGHVSVLFRRESYESVSTKDFRSLQMRHVGRGNQAVYISLTVTPGKSRIDVFVFPDFIHYKIIDDNAQVYVISVNAKMEATNKRLLEIAKEKQLLGQIINRS